MSKEAWFTEYEKLWNEREYSEGQQTDEQMAKRATEILLEKQLERADLAREEES